MSNSNYKFKVNANGVITGFTHLNESVTNIVIPSTVNGTKVTGLSNYLFRNNKTITSVTIPEGVISIGVEVFYKCTNLSNLILPSTLTSVGVRAFNYCTSLSNLTLPSNLTTIGVGAFGVCSSLKSAIIPEGVTSIEYGAFAWCVSLKSVTLPSTLTSVADGAFYKCPSLKDIYYNGTEKQWNKISIGDENEPLTNVNVCITINNPILSWESFYQQAISHFGKQHQENMCVEECAELIQAINKKHRGLNHNIAEEIADVEIMLTQLKIINDCNLEVEKIKLDKLLRLRNRLIKQMPKKVTHEATLSECPTCPNCKNVVGEFISKGHYATTPCCRFCGQALDWGDENA